MSILYARAGWTYSTGVKRPTGDNRRLQRHLTTRGPGPRRPARTRGFIAPTVVALLCFLSTTVPSQEGLPPLTVRGGIGAAQQGIEFPVPDTETGTDTLRISPNTPVFLLLGAAWRSLGATVAVNIPGSIDAIDERGVSDYTNLQLQFYRRRLAVDLGYQRHLGLYLANADEIVPSPRESRLSDMRLETIGTTVLWTSNPILNLTALYRLNELPEDSVLALVWMAAVSRVAVDAPTGPGAAVPGLDGSVWSEGMSIRSVSAVAGPGVAGAVAVRSFFIAPLASLGLGLQRSRYTASTGSGVEWNIVPQVSIRLSAGHNAPGWFAALVIVADARNVQTPFLEATQTSSRVELVFGRRYRMQRWQGTRGIDVRPNRAPSGPEVSRP
jgi:hypothetical protein